MIDLTSGDRGKATVDVTSLTFTSRNWNANLTETVTGVDDMTVDSDEVRSITLSIGDTVSDDEFDSVAGPDGQRHDGR